MDEFAITSKMENIERRLDYIERKANDPFDGQERQIEELKRQIEDLKFKIEALERKSTGF